MVEETENSERHRSGSKMGDKSPKKEPKEKEQKSKPRSGKGFTYEVVLLDGEHVNIELDKNAEGKDLFEKVCTHLDLIEKDYFGLQYVDERIPSPLKCWLSPDKKISKQKKRGPWLFDFALKFYPPDPTQLRESLTRWLVTLQTRRDILNGKLPATFLTQAMLGSYCVQADIGDYDSTEHHGIDYIRNIPFTANQTDDLLEKIVELHRQHKGQTPDEAEINYLENAKKLSMYGVDLHAAQDVNNVDIMIGVCASGLQVYREKLRISRFVWPKILKISYKRNHFYIKVRPHDNSRMENSVSFKLQTHRLAKRLWKICVEHHAFFRLREAEQPHNAALFPRLGSKFRYSGRTLYQARHSSQTLDRPDPYFERKEAARNTYSAPSSRARSVDELANRPAYWKDDLDAPVKRRPSDGRGEGRDRKDHMGQPTVISMLGLPEGMKPVESEQGRELEPGADRSRDGRDRHDLKPGEEDTTLERDEIPGTMGLTPAELQKKAKEDDKERKKREKEEEKKRKKEEEERKKAAKKGKGKGATDPTAEDRADIMGGGDATERAPGRTSGSYADQEGEPLRFAAVAPVGSAPDDKDKDRDKDGRSPGYDSGDRWEPGTAPDDDVEMRERRAPRRGDPEEEGDRFSSFRDPGGNDRWSFEKPKSARDSRSPGIYKDGRSPGGRDGDNRDRFAYPGREGGDRWGPGQDDRGRYVPGGDGREPYSPGREGPGRDGDRASWEPGREVRGPYAPYGGRDGRGPGEDGERDGRGPGEDGERDGRRPGEGGYRDLPPDAKDRRYLKPGESPTETDKERWGPGGVLLDFDKRDRKDSDKEEDKDAKKKKRRSGSDKDDEKDRKDSDKDDKDPKKDKKKGKKDKDRKGSDRDDSDREDKDPKKDKKKGKKDKDRKGSDKDDEKDRKHKDSDKENERDKDGDKPIKEEKKGGGFFSKFKKPKDSKSKLPEDDKAKHPEDDDRYPGYGKEGYPGRGDDRYPGYGKEDYPGHGDDRYPGYGDDRYPGSRDDRYPGSRDDRYPGSGEDRYPGSRDDRYPGYGKDDSRPGYGPGYGPGEQEPGRRRYPDSADADRKKGPAPYPGVKPGYIAPVGSAAGGPRYAPGMGVGSGDMSGVVGEETFVDNKMSFQPVVPPKKESRNSLKNPRLSGIDHTMPFFSPAATSTVGRPRSGKVPPPISPKPNNTSFDDSFSRRDYKTEKDGIQETRVEHRVVLSSTDDDFDYDAALAEAIRSVTEFNPDMSVERIECVQQIEEVKDK